MNDDPVDKTINLSESSMIYQNQMYPKLTFRGAFMKKIKSILNFILPNEFKIKLSLLKKVLTNEFKINNNIAGILLNPSCIENGLITNYSCNFMENDLFIESYNLGEKTGALRNHPGEIYWRAYVACWAANKAKTLPGDFVECGVNLGFLSRVITHYTSVKTS